MDPSLTGLRVLREIAERGTFTSAAAELGYTQSAVSRQVAALERETGATLLERRPDGARLTTAGLTLLRHARVILDELAAAERELTGARTDTRTVRLGVYVSAGATLLPGVLATLRHQHPAIRLTTREGTSPALIRALRAGTIDIAVVTSRPPHRPPDHELPLLTLTTLGEADLLLAVPEAGHLGGRESVSLDDLDGVDWIASPATGAEPLLGVWPGLAGRPRVAHSARDWLTKLRLVAAGCGVTTIAADLARTVPAGIRIVRVEGEPERRRTLAARLPGTPVPEVAAVIRALKGR